MEVEKKLDALIVKLDSAFKDESSCYQFILDRLFECDGLNVEQCSCYCIRTIDGKIIKLTDWNKARGINYKGLQPSKNYISVGVHAQPPSMVEPTDEGIFARCNRCNKKYRITKYTIFENMNLPIKILLLLILIAEYYNFDKKNDKKIKETIIEISYSDTFENIRKKSKNAEDCLNIKTITKYSKLFTNALYIKELQEYKLIDFLEYQNNY